MNEFEKIVLELVGKVSVLETKVSILQERVKDLENNPLCDDMDECDDKDENDTKKRRDKSRYSLDGETFLKNRFVWAVVKKYIGEHPEVTYDDLRTVFKDKMQGSLGVVNKIEKIDMKNRVRYFGFGKKEPFNKNEDIFVLKNGEEIAVCNQWGKENIQNIVKLANSLGYQVAKIIGIKKKIITEE